MCCTSRVAASSPSGTLCPLRCIVEKASIDEVYLDLTEEANRMLTECKDFQSEILDELLSQDLRVAGCSSAMDPVPGERNVPPGHIIQQSSLAASSSIAVIPSPTKGEIRTGDMCGGDMEEMEGEEYTCSSFDPGSVNGEDYEDSSRTVDDSSPHHTTNAMLFIGNGESSNTSMCHGTGQWPFNQVDWSKNVQEVGESLEGREDKLLLCGALMVQRLRADVWQELQYTCSGGVAHTKMLAKVRVGVSCYCHCVHCG